MYMYLFINKCALRVLPAETWLTVYRRLRVKGKDWRNSLDQVNPSAREQGDLNT